eukprot:10175_1
MEKQQHKQLLDDIVIMKEELIQTEHGNDDTIHKDTPQSNNSYHKLPSLESIMMNQVAVEHCHDLIQSNTNLSTKMADLRIDTSPTESTNANHTTHNKSHDTNHDTTRPLIRYGDELLIDHCDMKPISIAIVGECEEYVLRLCYSISSGRILSDSEFSTFPHTIFEYNVQCPYRTRLIPIQINCFYDSPDKLHLDYNELFTSINVWIIVVSPENSDINSWYTKHHGQWNNIISKHYPKSRRIIACVQPVDHLDDESSSYHISNSTDVKVKHVALYSMSSINELFEKAIGVALDDHFCQIMKSKYTQYCVRNIKYASTLWSAVEYISPLIWSANLVFNLMLIAYAFTVQQYTFAVLCSCTFLLLNILLTYQFVKIYCRSDHMDATKLVIIFVIGFLFGFLIPFFAYLHYHKKWIQDRLVSFIRTDIDESSLNDFSANVPIRPSCWGFAIHSITFTLPFTFLQVLMMIIDKRNNNNNILMVLILFVNMLTLLINSWCLIFTRTDRYAFIFAWICVVLDTFSGVLSILLTFYLPSEIGQLSPTVAILHECWWFKIYICGILSLGFEFLNIAESWEHITSGFFELLDHFRSYVSPIPRFQCIGAILAIIFISLGGLIIFFIFQTLGMIIFMFALYFLNWSWCLSLLDDQVMHEFDELYSSLIHFILSAHNEDDYALRLSVVNYELNPFTKKMKHVNYELLDMVHLKPKDWLFHGKKYFAEHFLWGAIGGYHYQKEKWLGLKEEYMPQKIPFNEKFPRLFWIGFFGCSAYIFQPLYTLVILFSNLYPFIVYIAVLMSTASLDLVRIPTVIHIMMFIYLLLIPCFIKYVYKAAKFAFTLFHIVSARKKLYKRPRQLFEAQDSMKFFARVWKHYIYVHVTLLRNQMVEEYFGDLYKEVLSLLSPLQRMDNLIELYEEMYSSHCGRVNIKFADFVVEEEMEQKLQKMTNPTGTNSSKIGETSAAHHNSNNHRLRSRHPRFSSRRSGHHHRLASSSSSAIAASTTTNTARSTKSLHSRKRDGHHNALLYDAENKRRRRLRKTKKTLLLDRSLIDLIDNTGPSDLNDEMDEDNDEEEHEDIDDEMEDGLDDVVDDHDVMHSHENTQSTSESPPHEFNRIASDIIEEEDHEQSTTDIQLQIEEKSRFPNQMNNDKIRMNRLHSTSSLSSLF